MKGLAVPKDAEDDVKQFAHNGAADGQRSQLTSLELLSPRSDGFRPAPGDAGRHEKGFAQKSVADFTQTGFAVEGFAYCFDRSNLDPAPDILHRGPRANPNQIHCH